MTTRPELFDLHVHSLASDGLYSLLQLLEAARLSGLSGIAVTDHDVLPDADRRSCPADAGVRMLPGVELSCEHAGVGIHLLAYGFDPLDAGLREACGHLQQERRRRRDRMLAALERRGVRLADAARHRLAALASPGRLHLARELVRARYAGNVRAAFARHLAFLSAEAQAFERLALAEAIARVHAAGGKVVLAHPHPRSTAKDWDTLVAAGLDGVECAFPGATPRRRRELETYAAERHLIVTRGSDFHGDNPQRYLGRFTVGADVIDALESRAGAELGCCWVTQWKAPKPVTSSAAGTPTSFRPGKSGAS